MRISLRSTSVDGHVERTRERGAELLPVAVLAIELPHLAQRSDVVRIERDDLGVVGLRVLGVPEVVAVPLGEVQAEADLLGRLGLRLEPVVRRLDDLTPAARALRHALEVLGRLAIVEVLRERVDEGVERLALVVELLLEDLRDATEQIRPVARLRARVEAAEIELDERLPAAARGVELLELARRPRRARVDLEDLLSRRASPCPAPAPSRARARRLRGTPRSSPPRPRGPPARCIFTSMTSVHCSSPR